MTSSLKILLWCQLVVFAFANNEGGREMCRHFSDLYMRRCSIGEAPGTDQIDQKISEAKRELAAEFDEKLLRLEERTNATIANAIENCELSFKGKCYRAFYGNPTVTLEPAKTMCSNIGWKLANLYSREHYDKVRTYLNKLTRGNVWLGMTYDVNTRRMYLSDGTEFTEQLTWYSEYPKGDSTWNQMSMDVNMNNRPSRQGMVNFPAHHTRHGVLCEM